VLLANHFIKQYAEKYGKRALELDKSAIEKLKIYTFPGNVRELQYCIERAVIMADGDILRAEDLTFSSIEALPLGAGGLNTEGGDDDDLKLSAIEKHTILKVIEKNNGNITKAAKELGLTRTALYRRLSKYEI
jgi:two-component system, NtrC family, response regulator HydG